MSGVSIVGELMRADAGLVARVAVENIRAGRLPDGATLPAILLRTVSSTERQALTRGDTVPTTDRVSATVRAASYLDQCDIMKLMLAACAGKIGTIAGFDSVAVLSAGAGPDVAGPADSYEQTQDFRVSFDAPF